jgi:hypothetical protein
MGMRRTTIEALRIAKLALLMAGSGNAGVPVNSAQTGAAASGGGTAVFNVCTLQGTQAIGLEIWLVAQDTTGASGSARVTTAVKSVNGVFSGVGGNNVIWQNKDGAINIAFSFGNNGVIGQFTITNNGANNISIKLVASALTVP